MSLAPPTIHGCLRVDGGVLLFFCVSVSVSVRPVAKEKWLLQAENAANVTRWMAAINDQICDLYVKTNNAAEVDYSSRG